MKALTAVFAAALAVLLVGCGASGGRYWYKAHPELPLLKMIFVDERVVTTQCGRQEGFGQKLIYGCIYRYPNGAVIYIATKDHAKWQIECYIKHEEVHRKGYDHDDRPPVMWECGDEID